MTKRFMVDDCGTLIDMTNRNTYDYVSDVCELLNELHEENEQLRTKNNAYIQDIEVFKEENTHLKLENEELKSSDTITDLETEIMNLKEENEQLKKEVEDLKQALIRSAFE